MVNEALLSLLVCPLGKAAPAARRGHVDLHEVRPAVLDRGRDTEHADRRGGAAARVPIAGRSAVRQVRRSEARLSECQLGSLEQGAILENDDVAGFHLMSFSQLDLAVDANPPGGDQRLGLAAALNAASQLERLGQIDGAIADLKRSPRGSFMLDQVTARTRARQAQRRHRVYAVTIRLPSSWLWP